MSDSGIAGNTLVMVILAILLPPIAVFLKKGAGIELIISIALWILTLGIGGIIYALYIVLKG